jgi:hypothetical protein
MFASRKEYGQAMEYCARTLDIVALTRVVNLLLDEYLEQGLCVTLFEASGALTRGTISRFREIYHPCRRYFSPLAIP